MSLDATPSPGRPIVLDFGPVVVELTLHGNLVPLLQEGKWWPRWRAFVPSATGPPTNTTILLDLDEARPIREGPNATTIVETNDGEELCWELVRTDLEAVVHTSGGGVVLRGRATPMWRSIDECLRLCWIAMSVGARRHAVVHGASTVAGGEAHLFPADGRTGKSTLAALTPGELVLSDDLSLISVDDAGEATVWPSPLSNPTSPSFCGELARGYRLASVAFLAQAPATEFVSVSVDEAVARLVSQLYVPAGAEAYLAASLELAERIVTSATRRGVLCLQRGDPPYPHLTEPGSQPGPASL